MGDLKMLKGLSKWKIVNSKEVKAVVAAINWQWGCDFSFDGGFLEGRDGDIFLISRDVEKLDLERLNIESLGLYFGQMRNNELRLSIEGSQIVGKMAAKNVIETTDDEFRQWIGGSDLEKDYNGCSGYAILKHGSYFAGCGKCKGGKILNFVPKARRVRQ